MGDTSTTGNEEKGDGTVIIGAGIIGLSTAYYLSRSGRTNAESIHLVDSSKELFHCASGFAGGFLAKDCMFCSRFAHRPIHLFIHILGVYTADSVWNL